MPTELIPSYLTEIDVILEVLQYDYQSNIDNKQLLGNALLAWKAVKYCIENDKPMPQWVKDYLHMAATKLLKIETAKKSAPHLIQNALGIRGTDFNSLKIDERDQIVFSLVNALRSRPLGKKLTRDQAFKAAQQRLKQEGLSIGIDSIRKAYDRLNTIYEENIQDYLAICRESKDSI